MFAPYLGPAGALGSSLTWAYGSAIYAREARRVGAVEVNLARTLVALPLFLATALLVGPADFRQINGTRLVWLALSTVCSYGAGDLLFYLAAARLSTATALAVASTYPAWAVLFAALTLGESVGWLHGGGTACCILGVVWLVTLRSGSGAQAKDPHDKGSPTAGLLLALAASLMWAGNTYCTRRGASGVPLFAANTVRYGVALLMLAPAHLLIRLRARRNLQHQTEPDAPGLLSRPRRFLLFAPIAVIEAFIGSSIFVYGLSHTVLTIAAPLTSLSPLFAVPIGLWLGTETLDLRRVLAILLTVAGVVMLVS